MNHLTENHRQEFENFVQEIMKKEEAAGIGVAIVDGKGETAYEQYFGYRDLEKKLPIDRDTIFGLASVTKSFTCIAMMQLAESGVLSLDDPVSKYIPEFTNKNQKETVKLWHLMCHSGGYFPQKRILVKDIADELGIKEENDKDFAYSEAIAEEGRKRVAQRLDSQTQFTGRPGQRMSYCNDGFGLLSEVIRMMGDQASFAEYIREHITKPLRMDRTSCEFLSPASDENSATLYWKKDGIIHADHNYYNNAFVLNGGGALKSTIRDMSRYLAMLLGKGTGLRGEEILSSCAVEELYKPRQFYLPGQFYGYGLVLKQLKDMTVIGHAGSLPGISSYLAWSYEANAGVVVLCNTRGISVSAIADAALCMYRGFSPVPEKASVSEETWTQAMIEKTVGTYRSGEGDTFTIFQKSENTVGVRINDQEQKSTVINPYTIKISSEFSNNAIQVIQEKEKICGIRYGSRIFPYERQK